MDFKSLMSAQIAKTKPKSPGVTEVSSKYQRRADVEREREAAYVAEQAKAEAEQAERLERKRKLEDEEAERSAIREEKKRKLAEESKARREAEELEEERLRRKRLGLPELPAPSNGETSDKDGTPLPEELADISDDELRSRLRALNEPAVLYEETHEARLKRFHKLTIKSLATKAKLYAGPIPTTLEPVPGEDMLLPEKVPPGRGAAAAAAMPERGYLFRQIASYFTLLLREWSKALDSRDAETKASSSGRAATVNYQIVLADLTPLFRKLESAYNNAVSTAAAAAVAAAASTSTTTATKSQRSKVDADEKPVLPPDLLNPLVEILSLTQNRRYRTATDAYLRLSIGKAAWPIGVTMVGIHERSAREKLHSDDKTAHIMSDEVTRKLLQSVKRCVSFAQTRWPPEDVGELMG